LVRRAGSPDEIEKAGMLSLYASWMVDRLIEVKGFGDSVGSGSPRQR